MINDEIRKCLVVCRFHHRIITHQRRPRNMITPMSIIVKNKKHEIGKCFECSRSVRESEEMCFDFDHVCESQKEYSISTLGASHRKDIEVMEFELKKCRLMCCHCHKVKTDRRAVERRKEIVGLSYVEPETFKVG